MSASIRPSSPKPTTLPVSSFVPRRELPALGLPRAREDRRGSALLSLALHGLIVMLLATPFAVHRMIVEQQQGAGGAGPAGGGGGGHAGTGGSREERERIQFVRVEPQPAAVSTQLPAQVVPPVPVPPSQPVKVEPVPTPTIQPPVVVATPAKLPDVSATPGTGGGSGHDGTNGSGPGSGGGVGSGIGTGRGSSVGPGTGGGNQANYPPQPIEIFLPPMPAPKNVHGFHLVAEFDVDSLGRVHGFDFTPTRDGDYNKRLRDMLRNVRFRPGTRPDGSPVRMKAQISYDF